MSKRFTILTLAVVVAAWAMVAVAGDMAWWDMEKCAMCKPMASTPGLMESMNFEQHNISNGIVSVATVSEDKVAAYHAAHGKMMEMAAAMQNGKKMELCGSCTAINSIMMKGGVNHEYVATSTGDVWICTSADAATVTALQGWAKKNSDEMAKMMNHDHSGGSH